MSRASIKSRVHSGMQEVVLGVGPAMRHAEDCRTIVHGMQRDSNGSIIGYGLNPTWPLPAPPPRAVLSDLAT